MIVITLARKPVEGSTTRNVYRYGTGTLNIEDTRLRWVSEADRPTQDEWNRMGSSGAVGANGFAGQISAGMKQAYADGLMPVPSGRWPANLIFQHKPGCRRNGSAQVKSSVTNPNGAVRRSGVHSPAGGHQTLGRVQPVTGYGNEEGLETIETWECVESCPVRCLNENAGTLSIPGNTRSTNSNVDRTPTPAKMLSSATRVAPARYDTGTTASRFFKQVGGDE
jgi:hypothetical protein